MRAEVDIRSEFEIGLQLPNGDIIYPPEEFHGRPLTTPEGRAQIVTALEHSESNMFYPEGGVTGAYHWVRREKQILIIERELGTEVLSFKDPSMVPDPVTTTVVTDGESAVQQA